MAVVKHVTLKILKHFLDLQKIAGFIKAALLIECLDLIKHILPSVDVKEIAVSHN